MGILGPGARIALESVMTPGGPLWQPRVMSSAESGKAG
jgi:hypothetical protein